uniref:Uncharacterized protein n=1 Tax=Nothoprocta perdicaria TaxID=30464 RepID=A0A8C6ZGR3_NOTPE
SGSLHGPSVARGTTLASPQSPGWQHHFAQSTTVKLRQRSTWDRGDMEEIPCFTARLKLLPNSTTSSLQDARHHLIWKGASCQPRSSVFSYSPPRNLPPLAVQNRVNRVLPVLPVIPPLIS